MWYNGYVLISAMPFFLKRSGERVRIFGVIMTPNKSYKIKRNKLYYGFVRFLASLYSRLFFKNKVIRNELKGKKGPIVVIANHQAALDFVNLIRRTREPMSFVISKSFYQLLPAPWFTGRLGLIPKQQFQTSLKDITTMKHAVADGEILVLYPAGLMCEDGVSTPIPVATYKFLQWIGADVYVARSYGTYFCTPKWATKKKNRWGQTEIDIYKLFDKEQLSEMEIDEIKERTDEALLFDAYREQDKLRHKYNGASDVRGLENVLYVCPHCKSEYTIYADGKDTLRCSHCGFAEKSDEYGMLHLASEVGEEIRYVSDWNKLIHDYERERILAGHDTLTSHAKIQCTTQKKRKYHDIGEGEITLHADRFTLIGSAYGEGVEVDAPTTNFASLPFSPGKYFEIQHGDAIYRCLPDDKRLVTKFVNMVKIFYELHNEATVRATDGK